MKKIDTIGRRDRYIQQPNDDNVVITQDDIYIAYYNHLFGGVGLPTSYLFGAGTHTSYGAFEKRMTKLRHNLKLFETGLWQKRTENPRRNCLINTNTDKANRLLKEHGMWRENTPKKSSSPFHDTYMSAVLASFKANSDFKLQHEVTQQPLFLTVDGYKGNPDTLGLIKTDKERLVFIEIDRATEPVRTKDQTRRSWHPKIKFYRHLIGRGHYKKIFNVECGAMLLILTVSNANRDNILSLVGEEFGSGCNYIMAQSYPYFGYDFHPPKEYLPVVTDPWHRYGHPPFYFKELSTASPC